ncbi:putative na+ h+ antiporter nha1 [Phaeomoniella chlamydospora]|uniref:Putative na+ h+ antiporter nha1 n=1 Tax=Phaeomoniella chlamydospora TaxID=158046 RepID=A0A0G2E985_PHACM|nr:putative na+ h+ antiporter nha1 [Phaeomoniella chlamydospora]
MIKAAEKKGIIDRESFLVFYFVLALFCAGSGSLLGMDDLLIGFAAGVGFSNDGWFTEKTEESHVSNVIDLLLNLAYFVYFGSIIPWDQFNNPSIGLVPWKLVVIALFVIFFRRIPAMLALKPIIPDVKTWREALFAGHFGPIGVGAIFAAILARAELETDGTTPLAELPTEDPDYKLIQLIWPITTFLVIASIIVHGSSIAVFTLGKRINTLSITLSYTQDNESRGWMDRLPRISSQSRSMAKSEESLSSLEKPQFPPDTLPPVGLPRNFLRRQREEDTSRPGSRASSLRPIRRRKTRDHELRPGGKVEESAIRPVRRSEQLLAQQESGSDTLLDQEKGEEERAQRRAAYETGEISEPPSPTRPQEDADIEVFEEGDELIIEDEEGNVIRQESTKGESPEEIARHISQTRRDLAAETTGEHAKHKHEPHGKTEGEEIEEVLEDAAGHPETAIRKQLGRFRGLSMSKKPADEAGPSETRPAKKKKTKPAPERKRGPAHAYQFGNTIIVEDEDGEVVKKITIPAGDRPRRPPGESGWLEKTGKVMGGDDMKKGLTRMGTWVGLGGGSVADADKAAVNAAAETAGDGGTMKVEHSPDDESDDEGIRYTVSKAERHGPFGTKREKPGDPPTVVSSGRRMSKQDFIKQIKSLDPKSRIEALQESTASEGVKRDIQRQANVPMVEEEPDYFTNHSRGRTRSSTAPSSSRPLPEGETPSPKQIPQDRTGLEQGQPRSKANPTNTSPPPPLQRVETSESLESVDIPIHNVTAALARYGQDTAAARRRERLSRTDVSDSEQEANVSPSGRGIPQDSDSEDIGETAAEKRRRLAALGTSRDEESSSDEDENAPRQTKHKVQFVTPESPQGNGDSPVPVAAENGGVRSGPPSRTSTRISWGGERGRERAAEIAGAGEEIEAGETKTGDDIAEGSGGEKKGGWRSKFRK